MEKTKNNAWFIGNELDSLYDQSHYMNKSRFMTNMENSTRAIFLNNGNKMEKLETSSGTTEATTNDSNKYNDCPFVLVQYVMPLFKIMHWFFFIPSKFIFCPVRKSHIKIEAGFLRKGIIILFQALSTLYLWNNLRRFGSAFNNDLGAIFIVMYICFVLLALSVYYVVWNYTECMRILLVRIEVVTKELVKDKELQMPRARFIDAFVCALLAFLGIFIIVYSLIYEMANGSLSFLNSTQSFLTALAKAAELNIYSGTGYLKPQQNQTIEEEVNYYTVAYSLGLGIPFLMVNLYQTGTWVSGFAGVILWGLLFRNLFQIYFQSIRRFETDPAMFRYIRIFQKITILIEDYNSIFGTSIFFCIISCILWSSNEVWSIFSTFGSNIVLNSLRLTILAIFGSTLIICSEVNQIANQMSLSIKTCYQHKRLWRNMFKEIGIGTEHQRTGHGYGNQKEELTQGLNMIHHDLQVNTIGFQGYGFFTITYSFIGTVMSVLVTYSVMIQQLQKANPT